MIFLDPVVDGGRQQEGLCAVGGFEAAAMEFSWGVLGKRGGECIVLKRSIIIQ